MTSWILRKARLYATRFATLQQMRGVSVGINHDTAGFAVNSIKSWRIYMDRKKYEGVDKIMITADGGGSNSVRD